MTLLADRPTGVPATSIPKPAPPELGPARPRAISSRTADDWYCLGGAFAGSLGLTWLLYTQVLPLSGKLGFVLSWYLIFVIAYAGLTAMTQPLTVVRDRIASALVQGGAAIVGLALAATLIYTFYRGFPAYRHWNFFSQTMKSAGPLTPLTHGGLEHAAVGTIIELGLAVVISLPLGVITAVYMVEVGGRFARVVRTVVEAMTALPDLVAGLFIYALLLRAFHYNRNGLCAAIALSITMLPIIARSADVVLRVVPSGLREASLALGASRWKTVWTVVLPTARAGLATSLILGMARGIGETAPLLIVSQPSNYWNVNPFGSAPMNSLSLYAYTGLRAGDATSASRGYGAACVLLVLVILLFIVIRLLTRPRRGGTPLMRRITQRRPVEQSVVQPDSVPVTHAPVPDPGPDLEPAAAGITTRQGGQSHQYRPIDPTEHDPFRPHYGDNQ